MKEKLEAKVEELITSVTTDPRWNLQDELLVQVLGFTLYGYAFGIGRLSLFMDVEEINEVSVEQLINLGVGPEYAKGLIGTAFNVFSDENNQSYESQLVEVGHSYFASENINECTNSIFHNTEALQQAKP